jgi:hypothetical protein
MKKIGILICHCYHTYAGGNVEYAPAEMKKNGADVIHLAAGLVEDEMG